jgi:hypothetical protein
MTAHAEGLRNPADTAKRPAMTASQLQDLLIARLTRKLGGSARRWRIAIGPVHLHDLATHGPFNWSVRPSGTPREVAEIERLLDTVRLDHPVLTAD